MALDGKGYADIASTLKVAQKNDQSCRNNLCIVESNYKKRKKSGDCREFTVKDDITQNQICFVFNQKIELAWNMKLVLIDMR